MPVAPSNVQYRISFCVLYIEIYFNRFVNTWCVNLFNFIRYTVGVCVCTVTSFSYICDLSHSIKKHSIILLTHILFGLFISFIGINFENTISCYDNNKKTTPYTRKCLQTLNFLSPIIHKLDINIHYLCSVCNMCYIRIRSIFTSSVHWSGHISPIFYIFWI